MPSRQRSFAAQNSASTMEIAIIGAGIGGLTTAIALKHANIPYRIYEAAPELKPVGAGIILANNAMQVLRHLGVDGKVIKHGNRISMIHLTRPDLKPLSTTDLHLFEAKFKVFNLAIHRSDLHNILAGEAGYQNISLNKRVKNIIAEKNNYHIEFEDGTTCGHEYVMAADGLRSKVRTILFEENELRNSGQLCWRGVTNLSVPGKYEHEANEAWGKGKRFGFVKLNDKQVYWYFVLNEEMAGNTTDIRPFLGDFHPLVRDIVDTTPQESINIAPLLDLKPFNNWFKENLCLLGDAAHATTPNLGQGACQAIEDAYVLGELLKKHSIKKAFELYPQLRREKTHEIVNVSWKIGKLSHLKNPLGIALRNFIMRITPARITNKQLEKIFTLDKL